MADRRFDAGALVRWTAALLQAAGVRPAHARSCARVLGAADLQGIDSHGVARLPAYVAMLERGALAVDAEPRVVHRTGATALVDARNVLGHPAAEQSMELAVELALEHGVGWVVTRNSNHYGIAGYYARQASEAGLVGLTATNAGTRVAPAGARQPFLGTNPLAVAAPTVQPPPFVLDMATSAVSTGKFELAAREGRPIAEGLGVDPQGQPTTDPARLADGGWLLPLGSLPELSRHKGSGLGMVVEVLTALLAGGPYGPGVHNLLFSDSEIPAGVSHFFCAVDPGPFCGRDGFAERVTAMLAEVRALPPEDPRRPVLTPGEPEWIQEQQRRREGVPMTEPVVDALSRLGARLGVPFEDLDLPADGEGSPGAR